MYINSFLFIFVFLPVALIAYYIVPNKIRPIILYILSLFFFALNSLNYLAAFIALTILNIAVGRGMTKLNDKSRARTALFIAAVVINASLIVFAKVPSGIILPIGISFFTFKSISYLSDIYMKRITLDSDVSRDLTYLSFFGQLQSGPISRYSDAVYKGRNITLISEGVYRFLIGFSKKVLIADTLAKITNECFSADISTISAPNAWLGAICWALELFYDFAGYSDMAIGISNMFGFECPENFIYPYTAGSFSKFWRKWHITLGAWFRDYIYIPLGGSRSPKKYRVYVNLFIVWLLTGLWHGITPNFIIWGMAYFLLISFEKLTGLPDKFRTVFGKIIYFVIFLVITVFLWVIFRCPDISYAAEYIAHMINPGAGLADWNMRVIYLIKQYWLFISAAILFCMPAAPLLRREFEKVPWLNALKNVVVPISVIGLFILSVSFVVSGINDPFAYANF